MENELLDLLMEAKMSKQALVPAAEFIKGFTSDLMALIPFAENSELRKRYLWRQIVAVNQVMETNQTLANANRNSILSSFTEAVMLGLEFGALQEAHLVPFEGKAQLVIGYRGLRRLAKQNKNIIDVETRLVYEGDDFDFQYGLDSYLRHKPSMSGEPGEIIFAYSIVSIIEPQTKQIIKHFKVMPRKHWEGIKKKSKAYRAFKAGKIKSTPWADDDFEPEMICKTCLRWTLKDFEQSPMLAQAQEIENAFEGGRQATFNAEILEKMPEDSIRQTTAKVDQANVILDGQLSDDKEDIDLAPSATPKRGRPKSEATLRKELQKAAEDVPDATLAEILNAHGIDGSLGDIPAGMVEMILRELFGATK
jgi:phage RecT family recombinase